MRFVGSGVAVVVSLLALGCTSKPKAEGVDAATAAVTADKDAEADGGAGGGDDVVPVYAIDPKAPAVPVAEKLCTGLTLMPEQKRAACCSTTPGIVFVKECTAALSAAIKSNAIVLADKDVDVCLADFEKTLEGCDWVGPFPPGPPRSCMGILKGNVGAGKKCRSSLECAGDLRCVGLGPTQPGTCTAPGAGGEACGGATDTLATYVRQNDLDKRHPECKERCIKHQCAPPIAEGGTCLISGDCQDGLQCLPAPGGGAGMKLAAKKCVAGKTPGKEGEPCPGGVCEGALQCINGKCGARKARDEECKDDFECRGGCLKSGGAVKGKCGPRCDIRG